MKDYKIKGTQLPIMPSNIAYGVIGLEEGLPNKNCEYPEDSILVSYGSKIVNGQVLILADVAGYTGVSFYTFFESDIIALVKEQGVDEEKTRYRIKPLR